MKPMLLAIAVVMAVGCTAREVEPIELPGSGGRVVLPLSGLAVTIPPTGGLKLKLQGSWSVGSSFDARDVIDEFDGEKIAGATWIMTGYFDAGDARAAVLSAQLTDAWPVTTFNAWGLEWQARGGIFQFTGSLGKQPVIVLAAQQGASYPTLFLYRFFLRQEKISGEDMIAQVKELPLLAAIVKAYREGRYGSSQPTRNAAVRMRGETPAARTVTLPQNDLKVALPDDGYVWSPKMDGTGQTDLLFRLAPTFPELTVDVLIVDAPTVAEAWKQYGLAPPPADTVIANLPDSWVVGPEVKPSSGRESTVARVAGGKVLIVGIIGATVTTDADPIAPVLEALARAAEAKFGR